MDDTELKYYCDDTFKKVDNDKWNYLLDYAFERSDYVEFNILTSDYKHRPEIETLSSDLIEKGEREYKIYPSGLYVRFTLTYKVKSFIKSKEYKDWYNYDLEDISFIKGDNEILATITHHNYIILQSTEKQRKELKDKGFNFWCDWGVDPAKDNMNYKENSILIRLKILFRKK
jgi:hypothetical protein